MKLIKFSLLIIAVVLALANSRKISKIEILKVETSISYLFEHNDHLHNDANQQLDHNNQSVEQSSVTIAGGGDARPGQFPYMVNLLWTENSGHFCGGCILSDRFILTAAHCLKDETVNSIYAAIGSIKRTAGTKYKLKEFIVHPNYNPSTKENDIALLRTVNIIKFTPNLVTIVRLPTKTTSAQENLTISGWGDMDEKGKKPLVLQFVGALSITKAKCKSYLKTLSLYDSQICVNYQTGKSSCGGDSGGPLVNKNKEVVGLVSFGPKCGDGNITNS